MKNTGVQAMYYEDREPNFLGKIWICLCRYWND